MNVEKSAFENLSTQYYPFAFALLPDELMATQLVIDAIGRWGITAAEAKVVSDNHEELELQFLNHLLELAHLRSRHFAFKRVEPFYKIGLADRALLYLRDKRNFNAEELSFIFGDRVENILARVHKARAALLAQIEQERPQARELE